MKLFYDERVARIRLIKVMELIGAEISFNGRMILHLSLHFNTDETDTR